MHELQFCCDSSIPRNDEEQKGEDAFVTRAVYSQRLLSVLVVDIRGYTKLAQVVDHAVLCQLIGSWCREAGQIMEKYGTWGLKYIGDAVMAVWLHDEQGTQKQVLRILRASCEFARSTAKLQQRFALPVPFGVGVGINTGIAVVGNTGSASQADFTALGDVVNTAFRIESCTRQIGWEMAIGTATLQALGGPVSFFQEHSVGLKGHDKDTTVWATSFQRIEEMLLSTEPNSCH
jgi:adenylate cyclase